MKYSHIFFQIILGMNLTMQYLCNLLLKKIWLASYPLLTLIRLLAQIIYLIKYYFILKIKFQLTHLFKLSFMIFVFLLVLKTANVIPVFEKDWKLDYSCYHPIFLLLNIEKVLEKLMYEGLYIILNNNDIT